MPTTTFIPRVLLLPLLVACNGGGTKPDTTDQADSDTDADADGDSDADTDSDTDTDTTEDADGDGFSVAEGDCDDTLATINPTATDLTGDGTDQNCDGVDGTDADGDGVASEVSGGTDCDDADLDTFPGATDTVGDGADQNCDGADGVDADGDGHGDLASGGDDCDDGEPAINPIATDVVGDTIDQNCDGVDGFDGDGDGFAASSSGGTDCDDADPLTFPGAAEIWYDDIDQGCHDPYGWCDIRDPYNPLNTGWCGDYDRDGDLFDAEVVGGPDCDDTDPLHNPNTWEQDDGVDNNCNGVVDGSSLTLAWDPVGATALHIEATDIGQGVGVNIMLFPDVAGNPFAGFMEGWGCNGDAAGFCIDDVSSAQTSFEDEYATLTYVVEWTSGFGPYPPGTTTSWGPRAALMCAVYYSNCVIVDATTL